MWIESQVPLYIIRPPYHMFPSLRTPIFCNCSALSAILSVQYLFRPCGLNHGRFILSLHEIPKGLAKRSSCQGDICHCLFFLSLVVACGWTAQLRTAIMHCIIPAQSREIKIPGLPFGPSVLHPRLLFLDSSKVYDHDGQGSHIIATPDERGEYLGYMPHGRNPSLCRSKASHSQGYVHRIVSRAWLFCRCSTSTLCTWLNIIDMLRDIHNVWFCRFDITESGSHGPGSYDRAVIRQVFSFA